MTPSSDLKDRQMNCAQLLCAFFSLLGNRTIMYHLPYGPVYPRLPWHWSLQLALILKNQPGCHNSNPCSLLAQRGQEVGLRGGVVSWVRIRSRLYF
jgi:hypothetical protein